VSKAPRVGSREWRERFDRDRRNFDRAWPWWVALSILSAVVFLVLVATGVLPVWLLFV